MTKKCILCNRYEAQNNNDYCDNCLSGIYSAMDFIEEEKQSYKDKFDYEDHFDKTIKRANDLDKEHLQHENFLDAIAIAFLYEKEYNSRKLIEAVQFAILNKKTSIGTKLQELLEEEPKRIELIQFMLKVDKSTIHAWTKKQKKPTAKQIVELSKIFNCTTDYLFGLSKLKTRLSNHYTESDLEVLQLYTQLDEKTKIQAKEYIQTLLQYNSYQNYKTY